MLALIFSLVGCKSSEGAGAGKSAWCGTTAACAEGQRCEAGACVAIHCAPDEYWEATGDACFVCPEAQTSTGGTVSACVDVSCAPDQLWQATTRQCEACAAGTTSEGGTSRECKAIRCERNERWDTTLRSCEACDAGYWSLGGASVDCLPISCGLDTIWSDADATCLPCDPGASSPGGAALVCTVIDCPVETFWSSQLHQCVACDEGQTSTGGTAAACLPIYCAPGGFWNAANHRCETCRADTSSPGGNVTACKPDPCPPESLRDSATGRCLPCPEGAHSAGGEAQLCEAAACEAQHRWNALTGTCDACVEGRTSSGGFAMACSSACRVAGYGSSLRLTGDASSGETAVDGGGGTARLGPVRTLRTDAATGRLLLFDGALRAMSLDGAVTTLVGASAFAGCGLAESPFAVDGLGGLVWFCPDLRRLVTRRVDGATIETPVAWPSERLARAVAVSPDERIYVAWSYRTCEDAAPAACWRAGISRVTREGALQDLWQTTAERSDFGLVTDMVVEAGHNAYVADPDAGRVHVVDLAAGTEKPLANVAGTVWTITAHRLALDADGVLFASGRRFASDGRQLTPSSPAMDASAALALAGPNDDVYLTRCIDGTDGRSCELWRWQSRCAP